MATNSNVVSIVGRAILHKAQMASFLCQAAIVLVIAGIRGGKTHVGALKMIVYAILHPCAPDEVHLVCSPTYPMSKVPVSKIFTLLYDKKLFPVNPLIKYIKSERTFVLRAANGGETRIQVVSLHDPDKVRGIKAKSAWVDEGAFVSEYAWSIIQGRVADSAGPIWVTTTPDGYNWVYGLYEQAIKEKRAGVPLHARTIRVFHWNSLENEFILDKSGFERLVEGYDEKTHQQEVGGRFVRGRGLVYHAFSRNRNLAHGEILKSLPVWVAQDFNVDPMVSLIAQPILTPDKKFEGAHVKQERYAGDSDTYKLCDFLDEFVEEHELNKKQVTIYPDASGRSRSTSGKSDFRILEEAGYNVDAPGKNPLVRDRVNCVNGLFQPRAQVTPHTRLLIDPHCERIIDDLGKQIWDPKKDPPEPDKSQGHDHGPDALGYMCWRRWPLRNETKLGGRKAA